MFLSYMDIFKMKKKVMFLYFFLLCKSLQPLFYV